MILATLLAAVVLQGGGGGGFPFSVETNGYTPFGTNYNANLYQDTSGCSAWTSQSGELWANASTTSFSGSGSAGAYFDYVVKTSAANSATKVIVTLKEDSFTSVFMRYATRPGGVSTDRLGVMADADLNTLINHTLYPHPTANLAWDDMKSGTTTRTIEVSLATIGLLKVGFFTIQSRQTQVSYYGEDSTINPSNPPGVRPRMEVQSDVYPSDFASWTGTILSITEA